MTVYGRVSPLVEPSRARRAALTLAFISTVSWLAGCAREHARSSAGVNRFEPAPSASEPSSTLGCSAQELARPSKRVITGLATYYADSLAGNSTASGEPYDPELLTAAHRSLPFGTRLRVRRASGTSPVLCVVVNDRGPFGSKKRVLDLSRRAAEALNMLSAGVISVRIEVL